MDHRDLRARDAEATFPNFPAGGLDTFRPFPALVLIDLADGWLGGCDLEDIGKVCDDAILCVYGLTPEQGGAVVGEGRVALGPDKFLGAGFRLFDRDVEGAEGLTSQVGASVEAGANALNFYNYGLIPARRLDWIRAAVDAL